MVVMKIRNACFSLIIAFFLCGVLFLLGIQKMTPWEVPYWLTSEGASYLMGKKVDADVAEHLSPADFVSGDLQAEIEEEVGSCIPAKASAMLGSATVQRAFIEASNMLFRWEAVPTFFGSDTVYFPSHDALTNLPEFNSEDYDWERLAIFADGLKSTAERYPDKRFVVWIEGVSAFDDDLPSSELLSRQITKSDTCEFLETRLEGTGNVFVMMLANASLDEYYSRHYRTDHHWNSVGALAAYNDIAMQLGLEGLFDSRQEIREAAFDGSQARSGLMMLKEPVFDSTLSFQCVEITNSDGSLEAGDDHALYMATSVLGRSHTFYEVYYGSYNPPYSRKLAGPGRGNALLLSDSFGAAIKRPLATQYQMLYTNWYLGWERNSELKLGTLIEDDGLDDIYFVGKAANYAQFPRRFPNFFEP